MDDSESPPSALEDVRRSRRSADHTHRAHRSSKDRERSYMGDTAKEIARLLIYDELEAKDLRKTVYNLREQLKSETERADAAEMRAQEAVSRLKITNEAKQAVEQEASRAQEELQLYKLELENARREIRRAQELLDTVDAQRLEAEESAARARTHARKWKEQNIAQIERERGRQDGLREGLANGRRLGFEEGRADGYVRGHNSAARAYMVAGGGDNNVPEEEEEEEPGPSGSFTPRNEPVQRVAQRQRPPSGRVSFPIPVVAEPPVPQMPRPEIPPRDQEIHPVIIHNAREPFPHPPIATMPDTFIPRQDEDHRLRLPPPHEMGSMPSPQPAAVSRRASIDSIPLMIPPPFGGTQDSALSDTEAAPLPSGYRRPKHRRRQSDESESTTMSQFDLLAPVNGHVHTRRQPALGAIEEERERSSVVSSPNPGSAYMRQSSSSYQTVHNGSSPRVHVQDFSSGTNAYARPRSPSSSPDSGRIQAPYPILRPTLDGRGGSSASSISSDFHITIEPPSRPESNVSRSSPMSPSRSYLSADDERPLPPMPAVNEFTQPDQGTQALPTHTVPPATTSTPSAVLNGPLPPGFVVSSFTPNVSTSPMPPLDMGVYTNPMTPAGIPLPSSIYSGTPSLVSTAFPVSQKVVIPTIYPGGQTPGPSRSREPYSRPPVNHASDSDGSSDSLHSLTTPPGRKMKTPRQPTYEVAPTPEHVVYPAPPRPQSTTSSGSRTSRAARIPLPASTLGTLSPASTAANIYARPIYGRSSSGLDAARSPSARSTPLSPLTGTGMSEPLSMPMSGGISTAPTMVPPPMTMPVIPQIERRQSSNSLRSGIYANAISPVEPPRTGPIYSPATSYTSLTTASTATATSKSKKKKAKAKSKSKFASVEEVPEED